MEVKMIIKKGFDAKGNQIYYNKETKKYFIENSTRKVVTQEVKTQAITLYLEGLSIRAVARFFKVSHVSVLNWIKKAFLALPKTEENVTEYRAIQLDEVWHFSQKKAKETGCGSLSIHIHSNPLGLK